MTLILGTLTFMYVSACSTVDEEYKRDVLSPWSRICAPR